MTLVVGWLGMEARVLRRNRGESVILALACLAIALWSISCEGERGTKTEFGPAAGFSLSSTNIVFTNQKVGSTSAPQSATLTNVGSAALELSSIGVAGPDASEFKLTTNCGSSLAASDQCTLLVAFSPSAAGTRTASVVFTDNATGSPQSLNLNGTGTVAAGVSITPTSLSFGSQGVATTSTVQVITVSNGSDSSLTISSLTISGADPSDFAVAADTCGAALEVDGACTIGVTFTPSATGQRTATLSIMVESGGAPQTASFTGSGNPDIILSWGSSPTSGVIGYDVYRGTAPGGESSTPLNSTPINGTTYVDENVTAGATYYYVLTSVSANGSQSARSNETEATVPAS